MIFKVKNIQILKENIRIAFQAIRSNLLRSILTVLIIAVGITALVGILTAIDSIKNSINSEFTRLGANTFIIESRGMRVHIGKKRLRSKNHEKITYRQATEFKETFNFPAISSISVHATGNATVKYDKIKTNPNIPVIGVDNDFLLTAGHEIETGRNFSTTDIQSMRYFAIIGKDLAEELFETSENPIDKVIFIAGSKYKIVGVLKSKGSSMSGGDKFVFIPVSNVRQNFADAETSYKINILPNDPMLLDISISEAEGHFRVIRKLNAQDESDFNISKSDNLANMLLDNIKYVTVAATIIGVITLIGAAIGLMNIMLVSVSERTREIGTRKAIGATAKIIKQQFLFESIIIGQLGGFLGILIGILIGNIMSVILNSPFVVPWLWIIGGVALCFVVGLASGYLPASKASKLDPIIALRYE